MNTEAPILNSQAPLAGGNAIKRQTRSKNESQIMKDKLAERTACKKQVKESFKSIDLFGQQVNLTWNGEDQYKTTIGATLSTAIWVVMLAYTIMRFTDMVSRNNPSIAKYSLIRLPEEDLPFTP
jgi:hypothetical protein